MTGPRPGVQRFIGVALLLPGLLLSHSFDAAAETSTVTTAKRTAQPVKISSVNKRKARVSAAKPGVDPPCIHVVRGRDTVGRVAARYRVTRQGIITGNRLGAPGALKVGQRISVPGCNRGGSSFRVEIPSLAPAVEIESGLLLARVGPKRIPTRLFVAVPEFGTEAIEFGWPVEGMVASGFGKRRMGWHAGIDIKADMGTPVLAAAAGTVSFSGWAGSYGRLVKIQHPNGFVTVYAHNTENIVQVGDAVEAGKMIATVGRSGRASAHHLHFEIRREGIAFNPLFLLDGRDLTPVFVSAPAEPLETAEPLGEEVDDDVRE